MSSQVVSILQRAVRGVITGLTFGHDRCACQSVAAAGDESRIFAQLRQGGVAVLLRHAQTVPGIGDPPGFGRACETQRNLSADGRVPRKCLANA